MDFNIEGTITYTFTPDEETAEKIIEYAKENKCTLANALWALYYDGNINIYDNQHGETVEGDYCTESISYNGSEEEDTEFEEF